jgi:hypothetical protein
LLLCCVYYYSSSSVEDDIDGVVCYYSPPPTVVSAVVVTLVSEVGAALVLVVVILVDNGIPLSHLHNVIWLSPVDVMSSIPTAIIPFNGANIPVELVWNTAVTMPLPSPSAAGLLNCTISYTVAVAVSPSSVLIVSFP